MTFAVRIARAALCSGLFIASAAADPWTAETAPSWGWKEEEVNRYREPPKAKPAPHAPPVAPFQAAPAGPLAEAPKPPPPAAVSGPAKAYCQNIDTAALDARFLKEKAEILRLQEELAKRTAQLEAKKAEYQQWLKRRDEFVSKATAGLVDLYTKMKPDAAALQLAAIDEEAAAALLMRLSPRSSSAILNQMDSAKAARLVSVMIGAAKHPGADAAPLQQPAPAAAPFNAAATPAAAPAGQELANAQPAGRTQ